MSGSTRDEIPSDERKNAEQGTERIVLNEAGLHPTESVARFPADPADEIDDSVHDVLVQDVGDPRKGDRRPACAVHRAVHNLSVENPQPARARLRAAHYRCVVQLINVALVGQHPVRTGPRLSQLFGRLRPSDIEPPR